MFYPSLPTRIGQYVLCLLFFTALSACTFQKAVSKYEKSKTVSSDKKATYTKAAIKKFEKAAKKGKWGPGPAFYLGKIKAEADQSPRTRIMVADTFCQLMDQFSQLPLKLKKKLAKYKAGKSDVVKAREQLEKNIFETMSRAGSMSDLLYLKSHSDCWPDNMVNSLYSIVPNKTINPESKVFERPEDDKWISLPLELPDESTIKNDPSYSCFSFKNGNPWGISYQDAAIIDQHFDTYILQDNFAAFWDIKENIWDIFRLHRPYCEMDHFKATFPNDVVAKDCWYEDSKDILCESNLRSLLKFHKQTPHTVLDPEICNQILCVANVKEQIPDLSMEEAEHLEDVRQIMNLYSSLIECGPYLRADALIQKVVYFAKKYKHHKMIFELAVHTLDFFATTAQFELAEKALTTFQPLYPDSMVCPQSFFFQISKQEFFDDFGEKLEAAKKNRQIPHKVAAWNTDVNDEYSLVSWGDTDEVFFVRKDGTGFAQVMTSFHENGKWTEPEVVPELSLSNDIILLGISENGRRMLVKSNKQLHLIYRPDIDKKWIPSSPIPLSPRVADFAWLSPNDSLLLVEYYSSPLRANQPPKKDIYMAKLNEEGEYAGLRPIGGGVNSPFTNEGNPVMALGGRMLLFTSDPMARLERKDMYRLNLKNPYDWENAEEVANLGFPINTAFQDEGITFLSEYTGMAYFHRYDRCNKNKDIWEVQLAPSNFPQNAIRLAGIVLDQHGQPINQGFMEYTPNYQLNVHAQVISSKGTYSYTVEDSTEVVRLFPEVPGYYSEFDKNYHLEDIPSGEIIRDTFRVTSFDFIRKNFKLINSTFKKGSAEFDKPEKAFPELTRLFKIAIRMGADIELHGHTDDTGNRNTNQQLSLDRAQAVKDFLINKCGFPGQRINVFSYGATQPVASNDTEEGRQKNRRIEIKFKMPKLVSGYTKK